MCLKLSVLCLVFYLGCVYGQRWEKAAVADIMTAFKLAEAQLDAIKDRVKRFL